ncbi:1-acyl-sn-glycerol-3-phosphate acyltransferase, partial [bacterium]|nr:1-acyl-sn-glycerol-3-phosphate acyltransferase [bacterium]
VPLVAAAIPVFVRGIEATRQFKWPFYGWVVRRLGNIPIERENIHGAIKAIHRAEEKLKSGVSMVVMPEGHRTRDGRMQPFKKLPFFLAKQAGVPIAPMGLSGLYELKRLGSWMIRPAPVRVRFGDPIPAETVRSLSEVELMNLTRERIRVLVDEPAAS